MLGYLVAAISPNMEVANALLPGYAISLLFFVGLVIRSQDQPAYWHWYATSKICASVPEVRL